MESLVVEPAVGSVVERIVDKLGEVLEYICCYASKVDSLQHETGDLRKKLEDINGLIGDAMRNGREILQEPNNWVNDSEKTLNDADDVVKDSSGLHHWCWPFSIGDCNCKRRYDVADKAVKLLEAIEKLMIKARPFNESTVSKRHRPQRLPARFAHPYMALPSRDGHLETLKGWLVGDQKRDIIGVYGKKGAGKTLLVKQLAVDLDSNRYDGEVNGVVYISAGISGTTDGLKSIQQSIADRLGLVHQNEDVTERGMWLTDRLVAINDVVVIIDDVEESSDLNTVGIPWSVEDKKGCRFVVVSSSSNICRMMKARMNLEVEPLSKEGSLYLFQELEKQYPNEGSSNTIQTGIDHISSKSTWLPVDVKKYFYKLLFGPQQPETKLDIQQTVASVISPNKAIIMLYANLLQIEHVESPQRWILLQNPSTHSWEAKLVEVWFLHIEGKAYEESLKPGPQYGAYFVYKLFPGTKGFNNNKVEFMVDKSVKKCYLDLLTAESMRSQGVIKDNEVPKRREGGWLEIEMGRFENKGHPDGEITLIVKNHNTNVVKTGLCVQGIELRPLDNN